MKKFKDLNASIADLEAVLGRNDLQSQQKKDVEAVIEAIKRLRRKPNLDRPEIFRTVREIADRLIRVFINTDLDRDA